MKLWQRIFFCAFLLTLLAVDVTMIVTLNLNFRTTVERETDRAAIQNAYYTETLRSEVVYRRLQEGRLRLQGGSGGRDHRRDGAESAGRTDRLVVCSSDGEPVGGEGRQELAMLPEEFRSSVQAADSMLSHDRGAGTAKLHAHRQPHRAGRQRHIRSTRCLMSRRSTGGWSSSSSSPESPAWYSRD